MRRRGAPTVRNTAGTASDFSLDRFARDLVVHGESLDAARSAGRQLLADLRRARVDVVTTFRPEGQALETTLEEGPAPPIEDLEEQLGELADELEWPGPPDYGREGAVGEFRRPMDATGRRIGFHVLVGSDGHLLRTGPTWAPRCDQPFLVEAFYLQPAPGCVGMDYRALVRASLLHALAEAFRRCVPSRCEQAVSKIVYASWACGSNTASGYVQLEVRCTAL